jgi:hypothetical protein
LSSFNLQRVRSKNLELAVKFRATFLLAFFFLSFILDSCYMRRVYPAYPEIIARNYSDYKYELNIKYHVRGQGSFYNFSLARWEGDDYHWIYLNSLVGCIEADSLVFTRYKQKTEYPWKQSDLKGYIEFLNDTLLNIDFQFPHYNDTGKVEYYRPYEFNGLFKLTVMQDTTK